MLISPLSRFDELYGFKRVARHLVVVRDERFDVERGESMRTEESSAIDGPGLGHGGHACERCWTKHGILSCQHVVVWAFLRSRLLYPLSFLLLLRLRQGREHCSTKNTCSPKFRYLSGIRILPKPLHFPIFLLPISKGWIAFCLQGPKPSQNRPITSKLENMTSILCSELLY